MNFLKLMNSNKDIAYVNMDNVTCFYEGANKGMTVIYFNTEDQDSINLKVFPEHIFKIIKEIKGE